MGEFIYNEWFLVVLPEMKSNQFPRLPGWDSCSRWCSFHWLIKKCFLCSLGRLPSITQLVAVDPYNYEELVRTRQDDASLLSYSLRKSNLQVFNRNERTANYNNNSISNNNN